MALCGSRQNVFCLSTFLLFLLLPHGASMAEVHPETTAKPKPKPDSKPDPKKKEEAPMLEPLKPNMTISPDKIQVKTLQDSVKDLKIECSTPEDPEKRMIGIAKIQISRNLLEPPPQIINPQAMVKAESTGDRQAQPILGVTDYFVEGEVPITGDKGKVAITIKAATCQDAGEYVCDLTYFNHIAQKEENKITITTRALLLTNPLAITMVTVPDLKKNKVSFGDELNITCIANVGSVKDDVYKVVWQWDYRDTSTFAKPWTKYEEEKDIDNSGDETESCSVKRSSTLQLELSARDARRDYRCMLVRMYSKTKMVAFEEGAVVTHLADHLVMKKVTSMTGAVLGILFGLIALGFGIGFGAYMWRKRQASKKIAEQELQKKRASMDERRRSLAIVVEKRKSLAEGEEAKNYDTILEKLHSSTTASEVGGGQSVVEETSTVESSVVSETSSAVPDESSVAGSEMSSMVDSSAAQPSTAAPETPEKKK